jgi:hypothetical protein
MDALGPFLLPILLIVAALIPVGILVVIASLALFIWSSKRIWPYPRAVGKWAASGRNFFPLAVLVTLVFAATFVLAMVEPTALLGLMILPFLPIVWLGADNIMAALVILVFLFLVGLAMIVWAVRSSRWLWRSYTAVFWGGLPWMWNMVWSRIPEQVERIEVRAPMAEARGMGALSWLRDVLQRAEAALLAAVAFTTRSARSFVAWLERSLEGSRKRLTAAVRGVVAFMTRNALLLVFPFLLLMGMALLAASVPLIPLYTVLISPYLVVSWVWKRLKGEGGSSDVGILGWSPWAPVFWLERRVEAIIDFFLRMVRLK